MRKQYYIGSKFPDVYLTRREAECAYHIVRGKSGKMIANMLNLSERTVEYYVGNVKRKLNCRKKSELIEKILDSEFLDGIDFS